MMQWDTGGARHFLMRIGLAFVMTWFGVQELRHPSDWAVFVPAFIANHAPVAVNDLILLHGFLLLLGAASVGLGVRYLPGCLLALGLLADITFGLWYNDGINDLVIRDIGLMAMAGGLALDPVRFWHLDSVLPRLFSPDASRASRRRAERDGKAAGFGAPAWLAQAGGAVGVVVVVLVLSVLLNATGSSGSGLPDSAVSAQPGTQSNKPTAAPSPAATTAPGATAPATPAPAVSATKFSDWKWASKSYQIYPGELSADAKTALSGFDLSVQDQGGQVLLTLKALTSKYQDHQQVVDKTNTVYFVETSMRDDPSGRENELDDDGIVVVTPDGYLLK